MSKERDELWRAIEILTELGEKIQRFVYVVHTIIILEDIGNE